MSNYTVCALCFCFLPLSSLEREIKNTSFIFPVRAWEWEGEERDRHRGHFATQKGERKEACVKRELFQNGCQCTCHCVREWAFSGGVNLPFSWSQLLLAVHVITSLTIIPASTYPFPSLFLAEEEVACLQPLSINLGNKLGAVCPAAGQFEQIVEDATE